MQKWGKVVRDAKHPDQDDGEQMRIVDIRETAIPLRSNIAIPASIFPR